MIIRGFIAIHLAAISVTTMATSAQPVWPPPYAAIELEIPQDTYPHGINEMGSIAGSVNAPSFGFIWLNGDFQYLRSINPLYVARGSDLNQDGWVVGQGGDLSGNFVPTLWIDGEPESLGTLGGDDGEAYAINNLGHVVGFADNAEQNPIAFLWRDGEMLELGTLGGGVSWAWGMNNLDQVVGHSFDPNLIGKRGFLWDNGVMIDIGTLPDGVECRALDINDLGQIVGQCRDADRNDIAFLWENGQMRSIHDFRFGDSSFAYRINNAGQVVGFMSGDGIFGVDAFIWDAVNGMRNLEDLMPPKMNMDTAEARDINDLGQIALRIRRDGKEIGVLLAPVNPTMTMDRPDPGLVGTRNTLTVTGATPGATVRFLYSLRGGGAIIPGCATRTNALQLADPQLIGSAIADQNGVATISRRVPNAARNKVILLQAVMQNECAISQLVVFRFE